MDSLTHIVLGACIGEVFVGRRYGKGGLVLGALAQSLPDIDFIASFWMDPSGDLLAHRGFTHSILFALLMIPLLAVIAHRWRRPHDVKFHTWFWFFGAELFTHLALDTANAYGTGWLEPFAHGRFSYNALFVADPLFSIIPGIVMIGLVVFKKHRKRQMWSIVAISWCAFYLLVSIGNKLIVEKEVATIAAEQHITYNRHFTTPTPLNNLLWYTVLESDSGYYIGYRSVFDRQHQMDFHYFPRNDSLLRHLRHNPEVRDLLRFSQGYYTVEKGNGSLVFNDLRFGQIIGWEDNSAPFVFHYFLEHPGTNRLVVQRGRFAKWNKAAVRSMLRRIKGE